MEFTILVNIYQGCFVIFSDFFSLDPYMSQLEPAWNTCIQKYKVTPKTEREVALGIPTCWEIFTLTSLDLKVAEGSYSEQ